MIQIIRLQTPPDPWLCQTVNPQHRAAWGAKGLSCSNIDPPLTSDRGKKERQ